MNSRPLNIDSLSDPQSLTPLTPNHLLTMKTKVVLPPPGAFQCVDKYCRKRWRRVQHLANQFWVRWKKEYLLNLQQRQKWLKPRRNLCVGDIVLIKGDEDLPRNRWQLVGLFRSCSATFEQLFGFGATFSPSSNFSDFEHFFSFLNNFLALLRQFVTKICLKTTH